MAGGEEAGEVARSNARNRVQDVLSQAHADLVTAGLIFFEYMDLDRSKALSRAAVVTGQALRDVIAGKTELG